uniref:Retinal rod rhodopsin-sensitive cGMP 3',5'-cyclic phosphodiesterase subunit gamma n=1 Tax=Bos mutus grunniens TaxID=30521 RepID=A0A8B9YR20_BOSMU
MNLEPPKAEIRSATRVMGGPVTPRKGPPKFKQRQTRQFKSKPPKKGVQGFGDDIPGMEGLGTGMTTTSVHLGPPARPAPHPRQRAPPPSCDSFPFPTASFRHHLSGVVPTQWVLGGAGRNKALAVPTPTPPHQQQGPPCTPPPPGLLYPLSSWARHPFNTPQR